MKIDKYIEIVTTPIAGLNLMPKSTQAIIFQTLSKHYAKVKLSVIEKESDLKKLVQNRPDLVFSGIKYVGFNSDSTKRESSEKLWLTDFLDENDILYTGSSRKALELEFDKGKAKKLIQSCGIKTAPYFIALPNQFNRNQIRLEFPLFIKPLYEGDSRGIDADSLVYNFESYEKKVLSIFQNHKTSSLVEKYLSGKEYTVGLLQNFIDDTYQVLPAEIIAVKDINGERILGFADKIADHELVLKITDENIKNEVSNLAAKCFQTLGAKGFGRIDIKIDNDGVPHFLEANLIPGLGMGYFYRCYHINTGLAHEDLILEITRKTLQLRKKTEQLGKNMSKVS
jgi:D-alanine-D-alanine ligase